jgi:large subunit ribosomal protein L24
MKPLVYKKASRKRTEAKPVRMKLHITKGDTVQVISGDDKGKRGAVLRVFPKTGRVVIEGVNMAKRHRKATQTTESGIVTFAAPLHHSKVMLIDPKTDAPTRIRRRKDADGTIERIAVRSGDTIQRNR